MKPNPIHASYESQRSRCTITNYTKNCIQCHTLTEIMQWYNYSLYTLWFANEGQIGFLDIIEH